MAITCGRVRVGAGGRGAGGGLGHTGGRIVPANVQSGQSYTSLYETLSRQTSDALSLARSITQPSHADAASHAAQHASAVLASRTLVATPPRRPLPAVTSKLHLSSCAALIVDAPQSTLIVDAPQSTRSEKRIFLL